MGNGNFGGETLQNGYHLLRKHRAFDLAYPKSPRIGPVLEEEVLISLRKQKPARLSLLLANINALPAGYHRYRGLLIATKSLSSLWSLETSFGYSGYYHLQDNLEPVFRDGVDYGILVRWKVEEKTVLAFWVYANAYRNDQTIPGVSLTFGSLDTQGLLTGTVLFP
jgi:hypothetical protein